MRRRIVNWNGEHPENGQVRRPFTKSQEPNTRNDSPWLTGRSLVGVSTVCQGTGR